MIISTWRPLLARRLNLALLVGTAVILLGTFPARATTSITTCPYTISAGGNYEVDKDLTCSSSDGIDIQVSHVHLNLNGHIITGGGSNNGILVEPASGPGPLTDIHILGPGLVQKFFEGIEFNAELAGSEVRNVTSAFNGNNGVVADFTGSASGLRLTENVTVSNQGLGIFLWNSTDGQLEDNDATFNLSGGIALAAGSGNELHGNRAEGNGEHGIVIEDDSTNNKVDGNATNGNSFIGIYLHSGSTGQVIQSNQSTGNGSVDMEDDNAPSCDSNNWHNNSFFTRSLPCIH